MSVSNKAKRRGEILDEIMRYHRRQLPKIMRDVPLQDVRAFAQTAPPPVDLAQVLSGQGVSLIAECKKASPSKGLLVRDYDAVALAKSYIRAGASAISVLTDARHFQGSLQDLRDVREATLAQRARRAEAQSPKSGKPVPILRKDFIFHPYQVYESRAAGADALLLIASVLGSGDLASLLEVTHDLGMNALVEVHTEAELERVLALEPRIVGINNRNLQTFEVDFENTARLRRKIPPGVVVVAESGIKNKDDVRSLTEIGVDAILVGEALVRSKDVYEAAKELVRAGRKSE
jgi:indole-3-glycerol phosphate synthase